MNFIDNVTLEELEADPYPFLARMRREAPVAFLPLSDQWIVTRWDDCEMIGNDATIAEASDPVMEQFFGPSIITARGDRHKWLRRGIDTPLKPRAVKGFIDGYGRTVAREYVQRLRPLGRADATGELLELVSVRVIGNVLGMKDVPDDTLQYWFHSLSRGLTNLGDDPALNEEADSVKSDLDAYMVAAIDRLTREPDESGLSQMIHASLNGTPPRTFNDLIGSIRVIILGGFQEPGHGAAASLYGMLSHPGQFEGVNEDREANIPLAIHEGLRWLSPFGVTGRRSIQDIEVGGTVIPAGSRIALCCGSANRDETRYDDPDTFDFRRPQVAHAAFGWGEHFCSGHFISRQLERVVLEEVMTGLPGLRLDPEHPAELWGWHVRGVKRLPVVWDR
ncbi:MAG TPA: cytochrome P450 [Pseudolysinimonas sp.]|nr:cytochrome P450 [Pseudolysinimonas sp.]